MATAEIRHAEPADAPAIARMLHDFNVEFDEPTPAAKASGGR